MNILDRSEWTTARNGRLGRPLLTSRVVGIAVHYPAAGDAPLNGLSKAQVAQRLRGWRDFHVRKGWADIGYNFAIDGSGRVWNLTGFNIGAHANAIGNPTRVGVLFVIGNNEQPSEEAIDAFLKLRQHILGTFKNATKVEGHQQVPGNSTACPGGPLMAAIRAGRLVGLPTVVRPVDNRPAVSLARAQRLSRRAGWSGAVTSKAARADRQRIKAALKSEGVPTYRRWQQSLGYTGKDADGIPGRASLVALGDKHGFRVVA
ncbi:N-acetylmuramoyl-L-alanine amidase [Nocardioides sp. STR2]|uniref:N-acetylmuramoyl-L-alanine amidase n=1 Tax=Nocardioides pini TaxID=2975053 RepID=A0ABT4CCK7_9ACTN|nr:N-acetylmuramoyl-L-alanine amidase [Nocardioides pini]MCY4726688.1 N-acetylmuramoyl-L-alanine amidase [Nocardioides pini]